jgi:hypothetical protein
VVEEVEAAIAANLTRAGRLRQAILKKAFAGELWCRRVRTMSRRWCYWRGFGRRGEVKRGSSRTVNAGCRECEKMMIDYLFRKPKFTVICCLNDFLITAKSEAVFQRRIDQVELTPEARYSLVDSTGADWQFNASEMYVFPTAKRKWSKAKIIRAYNESQNCRTTGLTYAEKSLSSKRFEEIFSDVVELIERSLAEDR